jgi:hypothetical protein
MQITYHAFGHINGGKGGKRNADGAFAHPQIGHRRLQQGENENAKKGGGVTKRPTYENNCCGFNSELARSSFR